MANNINKTDQLHKNLPPVLRTRYNRNWKALVEAIGTEDQSLVDLIAEVRKQFFVKTANRPYIDKLGSNVLVDRPRFIGMDDPTFRRYIPVFAYQPKQVKLIIDTLLDLFFFKESTTAFIMTGEIGPYYFENGWTLEYIVDGYKEELIKFTENDFTDISSATVDEVVAAINRQATNSFAVSFVDGVTKLIYIRIFSNTFGSKGSVEVTGGSANVSLQFDGFLTNTGNGTNTQWSVTKVGDTVTYQYIGGVSPNIENLKEDDVIISNIPGNIGSFSIYGVDIANNKFSFTNIFATPGTYTQSSSRDVKFMRPYQARVYLQDRRAVTWETRSGEVTVEMPTSPPVVRRELSGSSHINGITAIMQERVNSSTLRLPDVSKWPDSGTFIIQRKDAIKVRIITPTEDAVVTQSINGRLSIFEQKYSYTGKNTTNNWLVGVTPALPEISDTWQVNVASISRVSNVATVTTASVHNHHVGDYSIIYQTVNTPPALWNIGTTYAAGDAVLYNSTVYRSSQAGNLGNQPDISLAWWEPVDFDLNGAWEIIEVVDNYNYKVASSGVNMSSTGGTARIERIGMLTSGSTVILTDAQSNDITKITGPYIWDLEAAFVLSSKTGNIAERIKAGQVKKTLQLNTNNIPAEAGNVIFDFGTENQEGPVRYLFKPSSNVIALDPAYVFQYDHDINSAITMINRKGAHQMRGDGTEFAPYITDPTIAREVLEDLIRSVKSVGIFVNFLVRYPEQLYATQDVYRSGVDPG